MTRCFTFCLVLLSGCAFAQDANTLAEKYAAGTYPEFIQLLSIPNISRVAEDIQKNTAFLDAAFQKRGYKTTVWPNNERPLLFAEYPGAKPDRKTVLFYMHMDGQPVTPSEWHQESPFTPVLKHRTAGGWESISMDQLYSGHVDREWRIFARGAGDDKGPIGMFLAATDALRSTGREPAINIKVILDPEEEGGGAVGLRSFVKEKPDLLKADALVVFDMPQGENNKPLLVFGYRGGTNAQILVFAATFEAHSGNFGNYTPNPMQKLARLVGDMKDYDGHVTIPGFYDAVKIDATMRKTLDAVPFDETGLNKRLGIAARENVGRNLAEALMYPTLTLNRMVAGSLGTNGKVVPFVGGVIPSVASAEIAIRAVPETSPEFFRQVLSRYIESQGFHLVHGQPTAEERAKYSNLAAITVSEGGAGARTDMNSPMRGWMERAYGKAFRGPPDVLPQGGGGLPIGAIVDALKGPFIISPLANSDDNQHTSDENIRLGNYIDGTKSILSLFNEKF